jgi:hypothetical protein
LEKSSIKGFQIRWSKKANVSEAKKHQIRTELEHMSDEIFQAMNDTKTEALQNMRLPLPSKYARFRLYLTIEYGDDAWHLILETRAECIAEIIQEGKPFIQMLKASDVEVETI